MLNHALEVNPACAGMIPPVPPHGRPHGCKPRVCGDDPSYMPQGNMLEW